LKAVKSTVLASVAAAALALAACGGQQQPQPAPGPAGSARVMTSRDSAAREMFVAYRAAQMPSVYAVIGARDQLHLTSAQVTALDSIADAVREQNRPFADSLRRFVRPGYGGPIALPTNEAQQRDFTLYLRRMGENTRRGEAAIEALLTPEQRTAVCAISRESAAGRYGGYGRGEGRGEGGGGGFGGRGGMGGGYGGRRGGYGMMVGDSLGMGRGGGWPWCAGQMRPRGMRADSVRVDSARAARP
jgi:hypothetical protein